MKGLSYCLWFDKEAEEAARFYVSVFKSGKLGKVVHYGDEGREIHGQPKGKVMSVEWELEGHRFMGINGGPLFKPNESFSIMVNCETQEEIDYYWDRLVEGGGQHGQCGWLRDRYGFAWQVTPTILGEMMNDTNYERKERVVKAFMAMRKYDIAALKRAYDGK